MVHYTPLSYHDIYQQEAAQHEIVQYKGKMVSVQKNEQQQYQIMQLISTDPNDYLNKEFTPGNILPSIDHNK